MPGEYQPSAAPAPQNIPAAPAFNPGSAGGNDYSGGGQVVQNPALGRLGTPVQLPQGNMTPQPQLPFAQPGFMSQQEYNPYAQQNQQGYPSPYAPMQQANPYGAPQQTQSPYAAPPIPINGYPQPGQTPAGQVAPSPFDFLQPQQVAPQYPQQFPQQQQNPAFQFQPGYQPQQQAQPQQPQFQQQPQLPQGQQPQQQQFQYTPQNLTLDKLTQQQGGLTEQQVAQIFPDQTSQAVFNGMSQIAKGQNIDLLAAFGQAYERRDPTLINDRYLSQFDPQTVALLKGQFGALHQAAQQRDAAMEQQIYQMAGGEQQFKLAVQAFNTAADKQTVNAVAAMIDSGDPNQIHLAVQTILQSAGRNGNMIQRNGQSLTPNGGGQAPRDVMTNEAFRQHLGWLEQAFPVGSPEYNQHYEQLVAQRRQAKQMGY